MSDDRPPRVCEACGGDGGGESAPWGYNHVDGSPLTHWIICRPCGGTGEVPDDSELVTLDDLEEMP